MPPTERATVEGLIAADIAETPWRPLIDLDDPDHPTPQQQAYNSLADILLFGGGAGGGKSDLLVGTALTHHKRGIIFRREHKQLSALVDRAIQIRRTRDGYNDQKSRFTLSDGRSLRLGGMQHLGDEKAYQGQPHDFMGFDELTEFLEAQFRFVITWNRSTDPRQRCRVIGASNPPTTAEGEWVIQFWAPWLDDQHSNPALPGELRWFISTEDGDREVEDATPIELNGEIIIPRSRSFIPSLVEDNPFLMATGYRATLQALPEPLRSQMLKGDFLAGKEDNPWQVIPTEWVMAAQERWKARDKPKTPMDTMGVDPARGGKDETVLSPRHGEWFAEQIVEPGKETPDGPAVAAMVVSNMRDGAQANIDVIGVGASPYDLLKTNGVRVKGMNSSEATHGRDRTGSMGFFNRRSEWWWRMREALDPQYSENIALPPDRKLRADLCAPRWRIAARGIQVEAKEDTVKRIGRSPDRGDAAIYALAADRPPPGRGGRAARADSDYSAHRW